MPEKLISTPSPSPTPNPIPLLTRHFFRRFFDNDTVQVEGDTVTTVVRALAIVAAPGIALWFLLSNQYPDPRRSYPRPPWAAIGDQYFYVLFSFVVMAVVSIFEWQMLFPDRLDFLVLSPLPLKPAQLLTAKLSALFSFFALFLFATNLFGIVMLPALSHLNFPRQILAHAAATLLAGSFAALLFLALGGILLCLLDAARFRIASPILQMLSTMAVVLLLLHLIFYGDKLQALLALPLGNARFLPPLWFLGLYEHILDGPRAPAFALPMTRYALRATALSAAVVLITYPLAWARMRKMALEGTSRPLTPTAPWLTRLLHTALRRPGERALFHFIAQTLVRNNRYQVYLAMYAGSGLALAIASAVTVKVQTTATINLALSSPGLHVLLPLLLFWIVAGLRTAFAFPLNLSAGWIFRVTGIATSECAAAARKFALSTALVATAAILVALRIAHWDARQLLVQATCGLALSLLLSDTFFFSQRSVPFNRPRMPGRVSFPLMLTLYFCVFPLGIFGVVHLERILEQHLLKLFLVAAVTAATHIGLSILRRSTEEVEEEQEGYEGEIQLLGLS